MESIVAGICFVVSVVCAVSYVRLVKKEMREAKEDRLLW